MTCDLDSFQEGTVPAQEAAHLLDAAFSLVSVLGLSRAGRVCWARLLRALVFLVLMWFLHVTFVFIPCLEFICCHMGI